MSIIRAALIGLGRIGCLLEKDPLRIKPCTHMGALVSVPGIRVIAGCDRSLERCSEFSSSWGIKRTYTSHKELLKEESPVIISVSTWTDSHPEIVLDCLRSPSVRAVVCEKPIALDVRSAGKMVSEAQKQRKLLVINHERRFEDRYRKVKQMIKSGRIGTVRTVTGHVLTNVPVRLKSFQIDRSSLLHDGTHLIDLLHYFFGPPVSLRGRIDPKRKECVSAWIDFPDRVQAFIETGGLRRYFSFELDIQGTDGRILIGNTFQKLFLRKKSRHYTGFYDLEEIPFPLGKRYSYFTREMKEVRDWVCKKCKTVDSSGKDGLQALQVIHAVARSARQNGKQIKFL